MRSRKELAALCDTYAKGVVSGEVVAGRLIRLAAERHLRMREEAKYYWDADAAGKVGRFIELMPHIKGVWAGSGKTLTLGPWQCFMFLVPFGWKKHEGGPRLYRNVYEEVARKNGKSTMLAALGNYMFMADDEFGAEVYSGASSEKQAWEVFGPARLMALANPAGMIPHYGIAIGAKGMQCPKKNGRFEPLIGNPGDGASPHFAIIDEYHEHNTSNQLDTMTTGMLAREQPMSWVITTAGDDTAGPCYQLRTYGIEVLEGKVEDDGLFVVIFAPDDDDEWSSDAAILKANPNIGVSVFEDALRSDIAKAVNNPYRQSAVKRKHLNIWVGAASPYFNVERWKENADPELRMEDFKGETAFGGVDLSSKIDTATDVRLFRRMVTEDDGKEYAHYYVFSYIYLPEDRLLEAEGRHYAAWAENDYILVAGQSRTDYAVIQETLKADAERFGLILGVDPWNATETITTMQKHVGEDRVVEVPQTVNHLSEPMKEVQAVIEAGRIHHTGNPAEAWMIGNVMAKEDHKGNVFPRKSRPEKKIDFPVALIIAMSLALRHEPPKPSRYEDDDATLGAA